MEGNNFMTYYQADTEFGRSQTYFQRWKNDSFYHKKTYIDKNRKYQIIM